MGVQARPISMQDSSVTKSPTMEAANAPAPRKRCFMDIVLDADEKDSDYSYPLAIKRSKSEEKPKNSTECPSPSQSEPGAASPSKTEDKVVKPSRPNMTASQTITLDMLRPHFEKPLAQVAQVFGICVTLLKKICRKNGLARWPHRQIIGLRKSIASMEQAIDHFEGERRESYAQQLQKQRNKLVAVLEDPTKCNLLTGDDESTHAQHQAMDAMSSSMPHHAPRYYGHHDVYAAPERSYAPYPPQHSHYYYDPRYQPPPPPHHTEYVHPYYHQAYPPHPMAQRYSAPPPSLPPIRVDSHSALPSLSALMGRRW